jgi:plastocyanin
MPVHHPTAVVGSHTLLLASFETVDVRAAYDLAHGPRGDRLRHMASHRMGAQMDLRRFAIAWIAPLVLVACAGAVSTPAPVPARTDPPAAATASPAASTVVLPASAVGAATIKDTAFHPATLDVAAGTTVTWTNLDGFGHSVTADDGSFDSGTVSGGATFNHVFDTPGTYAYHCTIHSGMHGIITVH